MLAQNFLTAAELNITEEEREAAIAVLGMLERGELVDVGYGDSPEQFPKGFNMSFAYEQYKPCGTVACIGGWMAHHMKHPYPSSYVAHYNESDHRLDRLFFHYPRKAGVEHAAQALRNFLTRGEAHWAEIEIA